MSSGEASSRSAVVAEAVTAYLGGRSERALQRAYFQAAADPDYMRDNEDALRDFSALGDEDVIWTTPEGKA